MEIDTKAWYYEKNGIQIGPVAESVLLNLVQAGEIKTTTLVWNESFPDWVPAGSVEGIISKAYSPPPLPAGIASPAVVRVAFTPEGNQVRPWVRYWARWIDLGLFALLSGVLYGLADITVDSCFTYTILFVFNFVEAAMLSLWGATPGKAILRIRVQKENGAKLSYGQALLRSFEVWLLGLGLGLPVVSLITMIIASSRLDRDGITSWDKRGDFVVVHKELSSVRVTIVVMIVVAYLALAVWGHGL